MAMPDHFDRLKKALARKYKVERLVGSGGMAVVYLAHDRKHDRQVAIKVLHPDLTSSIGADRFQREIKIAARLSHPNILPLYDSGKTAGLFYYVMPFVDGQSLASRIRHERQLTIEQAIDIVKAIARGLDYAHAKGVVHRDIKPDNILFNAGTAMLADFGIAKALSAVTEEALTQTGVTLGTPAYMSPEQASGESHIDAKTDTYSLACVMYEMLAGHPPFVGSNARAVMARHVTDPVPPLRTVRPTVSEGLEQAVQKALSKVPMDRFASPGEFAHALVASGSEQAAIDVKSVAVLPFRILSLDPENEYFGDGLIDEIIASLSRIQSLRVISRSSTVQFKNTQKDVRTIGRELHARYVVEGSVRAVRDKLRITVQLIDASNDAPLWSEGFSGVVEDGFDIQERVSNAVAEATRVRLVPEERRAHTALSISDSRAYESYLRARKDIWRLTEESIVHALQYLQETLDAVGDDVLLYAAIAEAYYLFPHIAGNQTAACFDRVKECADRIFELEPESAYGYCFLGLLWTKRLDGMHEGAQHLKKALDLSPVDPSILLWHGYHAAAVGKSVNAERCVEKLFEVDPLSMLTHRNRGWVRLMNGETGRALESLRKAYQLDSDNPQVRFLYAYVLALCGEQNEAFGLIDRIMKDAPNTVWAWLGRFYKNALLGEKRRALRNVTERFKQASDWIETYSYHMAECYALIDEKTLAVDCLENAARRGFLNYPLLATGTPFLEGVREEARFRQLLGHVKRQWERLEI